MKRLKMKHIVNTMLALFLWAGTMGQDTLQKEEPDSGRFYEAEAMRLFMLDSLKMEKQKNDSLKWVLQQYAEEKDSLAEQLTLLNELSNSLSMNNKELNTKIMQLNKEIQIKDSLVENQIASLRETESILAEKEQIYKNLLYDYKMDSLELAMKIQSKNIELKSQQNVTSLLEMSIEEKKKEIEKTNTELKSIRSRSEKSQAEISILKDSIAALNIRITEKTKDLVRSEELIKGSKKEIRRLEKELDHCKNKDKKKTVRVVQGVAVRTFRTPDYALAPKDVNNVNVYVIDNKNSGNFEIDYLTGASIKLVELFKTSKTQSDLSLFVGIGGKDLFKNYYIAPNLCLFSAIHLSFGLNLHEYETLKSGFSEGDALTVGTPIPTNNEWKVNGYFGITLDLSVASGVFKK